MMNTLHTQITKLIAILKEINADEQQNKFIKEMLSQGTYRIAALHEYLDKQLKNMH